MTTLGLGYEKKSQVYAGSHGFWEALDRLMAFWPLKGVLLRPGG